MAAFHTTRETPFKHHTAFQTNKKPSAFSLSQHTKSEDRLLCPPMAAFHTTRGKNPVTARRPQLLAWDVLPEVALAQATQEAPLPRPRNGYTRPYTHTYTYTHAPGRPSTHPEAKNRNPVIALSPQPHGECLPNPMETKMSFSEPRLDYHTQDIRLLNSPSIPALLLTGLRRVRRVGLLGADPPALLVQSALHLRSGNVFVGANEIRWPPFYVCLFSCLGHLRVAPQRRHRAPDLA
jgi:hypothetical protein